MGNKIYQLQIAISGASLPNLWKKMSSRRHQENQKKAWDPIHWLN